MNQQEFDQSEYQDRMADDSLLSFFIASHEPYMPMHKRDWLMCTAIPGNYACFVRTEDPAQPGGTIYTLEDVHRF